MSFSIMTLVISFVLSSFSIPVARDLWITQLAVKRHSIWLPVFFFNIFKGFLNATSLGFIRNTIRIIMATRTRPVELPPKGSGLFCAARIALANTLHFRYNVSDNGENGHKQARQLLALPGEIERRIL